MTIAFSYQLFG